MTSQTLWILGIAYSALAALVAAVYKALTGRIASLEKRFGNSDDVWGSKMPTIIASSTRLDELDRRMGKMEDNLQRWMERIDEKMERMSSKIDGIGRE